MSGILRLESLTKGDTLKQGDKTPLKYRLFDAGGEKLSVAGKPAKVRLAHRDFLTIGYEKDGLTVAQDDTVTFTIDSIIPPRIYYVEIIVDDKFIFPSRPDESKFTVNKSSLGVETDIIQIIGKEEIARDVKARVENELEPFLEEIEQAEAQRQSTFEANEQIVKSKAEEAVTKANQADNLSKSVQSQFNQVVIEGDSSVEASQARVDANGEHFNTLKERLDKEHTEVTSQLAKTVRQVNDIKPVNVKDFGAKDIYTDGNINFDSTIAFQSAIDYALDNNKQGGKLFVPTGTYNISDELVIPKTIQIEGVSERAFTIENGVSKSFGSAIIQKNPDKSIFKFTGNCYGVEISKVFLRGGKYGIEIVDGIIFSEFIFEKIHFNGIIEAAIRLRGSIGRISDCDLSSGGSHTYGIDMVSVSSVWIEHNNFWQCNVAHINFNSVNDIHISYNWFEYTGRTCLLLQAPISLDKVTVSNCDFHAGQGTAIEYDAVTHPTDIFAVSDLLIEDCRLSSQKSSIANEAIKIRVKGNTNLNNRYNLNIRDTILSNVKQCGITTDIQFSQMVLENVKAFYEFSYNNAPLIVGVGDVVPAARQYKLGHSFTLNSGIKFEPKANEGWVNDLLYKSASSGHLTYRGGTANVDTRRVIMASNQDMSYSSGDDNASLKANLDAIRQIMKDVGLIN